MKADIAVRKPVHVHGHGRNLPIWLLFCGLLAEQYRQVQPSNVDITRNISYHAPQSKYQRTDRSVGTAVT